MQPTAEQAAARDACMAGENIILEAGAGTGKTSTCKIIAEEFTRRGNGRGLYAAFNRVTKDEARERFPRGVHCATSHGLAWKGFGSKLSHKLPNARPALKLSEIAAHFGLEAIQLDPIGGGQGCWVQPERLAWAAQNAIARFCRSADPRPLTRHVAKDALPENVNRSQYNAAVLAATESLWADLADPDGMLRMPHDVYRKLWALSEPKLRFDWFMLDEAQDTAPVVAAVLLGQHHMQKIAVGDSSQQLYGWAGAVDAMANWPGARRLYLTQSWRFGEVIAEQANRWLSLLPTSLRLTGNPALTSSLGELTPGTADAVLCRTNVGAMGVVLTALADGLRVALVGGGREIESLAWAGKKLMAGQRTTHPELCVFDTWDEVRRAAAAEEADGALRMFVSMMERFGADEVIEAMRTLSQERDAQVVVSTGHKAKGREWHRVMVAGDFAPKTEDDDGPATVDAETAMLAYVAVTRAQTVLDRGPLVYVDSLTDTVIGS
jgi:AAA domain/UvrD-like helicase C-terminal domain